MAEHHPLRTLDQNPTTAVYAQYNTEAERRANQCRSAKMPSLTHLRRCDYDTVYEPSDDTYILIDAIGMDMDYLAENKTDEANDSVRVRSKITTLEIGCGTGVPTVYLAMRLRGMGDDRQNMSDIAHRECENDSACLMNECKPTDDSNRAIHYVTDINPDAIRIAKATAQVNGIPSSDFQAVQCDLASDVLPQLQGRIDILIFNPPYVPTPDDEVGSKGIEASWAGGTNGRVVLDRALPQIAQLLAFPNGVAYVVVVDDNYPEELAQRMKKNFGITTIPWLRRRARNEFLSVLKMTPTRKFQSYDSG